jgi:hypothetical protein
MPAGFHCRVANGAAPDVTVLLGLRGTMNSWRKRLAQAAKRALEDQELSLRTTQGRSA